MDTERYLEFLLTRRSIRKYKSDPVPPDLLIKIVDIARYAPSARNSQPWEFVIVTDPEVKSKLASIYPWRQPLHDAPAGIVVLCDETISPYFYVQDCSNAVMYIMLAAHALGLGAVWLGVGEKEKAKIKEILDAPEHKVPIAIVVIGWPDEKPEPRHRRSVGEMVHINKYGNRVITK